MFATFSVFCVFLWNSSCSIQLWSMSRDDWVECWGIKLLFFMCLLVVCVCLMSLFACFFVVSIAFGWMRGICALLMFVLWGWLRVWTSDFYMSDCWVHYKRQCLHCRIIRTESGFLRCEALLLILHLPLDESTYCTKSLMQFLINTSIDIYVYLG